MLSLSQCWHWCPRFMKGTWTQMFISEIIVKRQHNTIRYLDWFLILNGRIYISLQGSRADKAKLTAPEGEITDFQKKSILRLSSVHSVFCCRLTFSLGTQKKCSPSGSNVRSSWKSKWWQIQKMWSTNIYKTGSANGCSAEWYKSNPIQPIFTKFFQRGCHELWGAEYQSDWRALCWPYNWWPRNFQVVVLGEFTYQQALRILRGVPLKKQD